MGGTAHKSVDFEFVSVSMAESETNETLIGTHHVLILHVLAVCSDTAQDLQR